MTAFFLRRTKEVAMAVTVSQVYSRLVSPVRGKILAGVLLTALSSIAGFIPYVAIARVAQMALEGGVLSFESLLPWIVAAILGALFSRLLFGWATGICHYADADFRVNARTVLLDHLEKVPLGWFSDNSSAEVKQAATDDVLNMHQSVGHAPVDVTSAILSPLLPLVYLFAVDWRFSLAILGFFVLVLVVSAPLMFKGYGPLNDTYNSSLVELSSATVEMVEGISVVKTFGAASRASRRFGKAVHDLTDICYVWTKQTSSPFSVVFALFSPATVLVILLGISLLFTAQGWLAFSQCIPFLVLGVGVPAQLINLFTPVRFLRQAMQSAEHLARVLSVESLAEPANPQEPAGDSLAIGFDGVSFVYGEGLSKALDDVSVRLEPGTVTALVGSSGSGKTTFARLVPRFWDPTEGSVTMGGTDVRAMATSQVLSRVAIVFQDTVLLRESIRDNIRLGRMDATDEEVIAASKNAQIHDRIMSLPNGYDTVVGSDDGDLSGGEMQRVAIARAMLQDAPILVLDEATAHSDPENETAIQKALSNLAKGRTTVVIAHRLNTIAHADRILVLKSGSIIEQGRHEELLAKGGEYASLWAAQQIGSGGRRPGTQEERFEAKGGAA